MAVGLMCSLCGCASSTSRPYTAESVIKAQQTAAPQTAAPPAEPNVIYTPPVQAPPYPTPQDYVGINLGHWIAKTSEHGKVLVLEDGSVWEINPAYQSKTLVWMVAQKVVVSNGANPQYPYQLANGETKEVVQGRFVGGTGPH